MPKEALIRKRAGNHFGAPNAAELHINVVYTGVDGMDPRLSHLSLEDGVAAQRLLFCQGESRTGPFWSGGIGLWRWEIKSSRQARAWGDKGSEQLQKLISLGRLNRGNTGTIQLRGRGSLLCRHHRFEGVVG